MANPEEILNDIDKSVREIRGKLDTVRRAFYKICYSPGITLEEAQKITREVIEIIGK